MILIDFRYQFLSINYVWCMARRETRLAVHKQSFLKWLPCDRSVVAGPKGACVTQAAWLSSCTGNPGSVILPQYGSSKITVLVWGKNIILKFLGNTK